ncbi:hypothetical protein HY971_02035 [Candidatus Kaiserbacteria bacterium]|nr:hypothetical protein [Candidatus Kaiserbacteria bacterium]
MRSAIFVLLLFISFGGGVSTAYVLITPVHIEEGLADRPQVDVIQHGTIVARGIIVGVNTQARVFLLERLSPFDPSTTTRLEINYGDKHIRYADRSVSSDDGLGAPVVISSGIVNLPVRAFIKNQVGPFEVDDIASPAPHP